MEYRVLGSTGIRVSAICFGAGPVSGWMSELTPEEQQRVVRRALDVGIKWFDTAAGYGNGLSEASLGTAFARLGLPPDVHLATKVRYRPEHFADIRRHTRDSFEGSLRRLRVRQVTLLQLHNAITSRREEEPTSITPQDVLGPGGVLEAFQELRSEGRVRYLGLTGIGQAAALRAAVESGAFATMQVPYNLLNPSAGHRMPEAFPEANYGNIIADCAMQGMGVFAIRVFAAGALAGNPPSAHTLKTPFFPLALYQRDQRRAARLQKLLGLDRNLKTEAIRFVLSHPHVSAAIIGLREPWQIDEAAASLATGPLPAEVLKTLLQVAADEAHSMGESAEHGSED
jgi:L-galactose dehydrogenase/L-glyceraldehyde 3-phosphate reductase